MKYLNWYVTTLIELSCHIDTAWIAPAHYLNLEIDIAGIVFFHKWH